MPSYLFASQVYCFHNAGTFSTKKETHLYKAYTLLKRVDLDLYKYVCADNGTELMRSAKGKQCLMENSCLFNGRHKKEQAGRVH